MSNNNSKVIDTVLSQKSVQAKKSIDISFKNIKYSVKDNKGQTRDILNNITGYCPVGQITAILGASGAGKTSLLNILSCRVGQTKKVTLSGSIVANGIEYNADIFSSFAAYVMQNDILFETFSPREAFQFVANLKYVDQKVKTYYVDEAIRAMKLQNCQNALIGGVSFKGISGGERKRASIGFELVTNPSCILLDEPTSGLDSFTAFQIINVLANLAHKEEKTIIFTIHQPSSDIYLLFDRVMLLVQGKFIYQGSRATLVDYFKGIGFECPSLSNPMDYMMSIMHTNEQNAKYFPVFFHSYEQMLYQLVLEDIKNSSTAELTLKQVETSTLYQIQLITKRSIDSFIRNKQFIRQRIGQAIFMGLLIGGAFFGIGSNSGNYSDYSNVAGLMFVLVMNLTMESLFPVVLQFSTERDVFLREENSKLYTTFSYFVGKSLVEIPFCLIGPIVQEMILYWMVDLNYKTAGIVFIHLFIAIIIALNGNSIGLMAGCAFNDIKVATSMVPLLFTPLIIFSGFFANIKQFYSWIGWIQYISPMKYSFEALATNEFDSRIYYFGTPTEVLGFDIGMWQSIGVLIGFVVFFRFVAFILLYLLRTKQQ